jgi:hypothetical protein
MGRLFVDYSGTPPTVDALRTANVAGMWRYVGTPQFGKNLTAREYQVLTAAGFEVYGIFELDTGDWRAGRLGGSRNAAKARADFTACGAPPDRLIAATVDEHVSVTDMPTALQYQLGAHDVLGASAACYGPPEVMHAVRQDGTAMVLWQWGIAPAAANPDRVGFYQHGQQVISGTVCDLSTELIPAPGGLLPAGTVLRRGSTGWQVAVLQRGLNVQYPLYSHLVVDGVFGPLTEGVVREFQARAHLVVDGVAGPITLGALHLLA